MTLSASLAYSNALRSFLRRKSFNWTTLPSSSNSMEAGTLMERCGPRKCCVTLVSTVCRSRNHSDIQHAVIDVGVGREIDGTGVATRIVDDNLPGLPLPERVAFPRSVERADFDRKWVLPRQFLQPGQIKSDL